MSHHAISTLFIAALLFAITGCTQEPAGNVNDGANHGANQGTHQGTNQGAGHGVNQGADHGADQAVDQGADRGTNRGVQADPAAPAVDRTTATEPGTTDQDRDLDVVVEEEVE